jgi:mannose-1-phosphate guanylyltransferase
LSVLKAVILVGGLGTRLRPLTNDMPKSVLPVLNRPFMEYTFAYLRHYGIEDIILAINYLPDVIRKYLGDGSRYGVRLTYCYESEPMGTAGAIKNAERYLDSTFVALNGDIFTDLVLTDMLELHYAKGARATISLQWVDDPSAFGVVETDVSSKVLRFIEKPPRAEATTNWINAGIYVLEPEVLKYIPENQHYMVERGLFPALLDMGEPVYGYQFRGYWLDMGTPEAYLNLNRALLSGKTISPVLQPAGKNNVCYESDVFVYPSTRITGPVLIGNRCNIGERVIVNGPVVIGDDCYIDNDCVVESALLWNNVHAGHGVKLSRCIIGNNVNIKDGRQLRDCVITSTATAALPAVVN